MKRAVLKLCFLSINLLGADLLASDQLPMEINKEKLNVGKKFSNEKIPKKQYLKKIYSKEKKFCTDAMKKIKNSPTCRAFDFRPDSDLCSWNGPIGGNTTYWGGTQLEQIAASRYGYSRIIKVVHDKNLTFEILYLDLFINDRHDRVTETWKVEKVDLELILKLKKDVDERDVGGPGIGFGEHEFSAMLSRGEKISEEWSPVLNFNENIHLVERQCKGHWYLADNYQCEKVKRIRVIRASSNSANATICEFAVMQ